MASILIQTADAIVTELNTPTGHTWSLEFTAERSYADWDLALDDTAQRGVLLCDVVPVSRLPVALETQSSVAYSPAIDVVFRKKFEPADAQVDDGKITLSAVDELVTLVEEVNEYFAAMRLTGFDSAVWDPSRDIELTAVIHRHLREHDQYTGIIRLPFLASQSLT